jgi:Disulphide isomerase
MPYPEMLVAPMRQDLTRAGVEELRTAVDVDAAKGTSGSLMIAVNSVCGCGADIEATDRARHYFTGYQPSSPSVGLLRDGTLVFMLERIQIENRDALQIAAILTDAYEQFCQPIATP